MPGRWELRPPLLELGGLEGLGLVLPLSPRLWQLQQLVAPLWGHSLSWQGLEQPVCPSSPPLQWKGGKQEQKGHSIPEKTSGNISSYSHSILGK